MRAISAAGNAATAPGAPFALNGIVLAGQSNAIGGGTAATPALTTTHYGNAAILADACQEWQSSHGYASGAYVVPTAQWGFAPGTTGKYMWQAQGAGTSGGTEPTWPASPTVGTTTVSDGGVTWKCAEHKNQPFDTTVPASVSLSLGALVEPVRPLLASGSQGYPWNIAAANVETQDAALAAAIRSLAVSVGGFADYRCVTTNVGISGAALTAIQKGGTTNAYAASLFEANAIKAIAGAAPSYGVIAVALIHGTTDATNPAYGAGLVQLQADYDADLRAITGQTRPIPMLIVQQTEYPPVGSGNDLSAEQVWQICQNSNGKLVHAGPDYWVTFEPADLHYDAAGRQRQGEWIGYVYWILASTDRFEPLWPISFRRTGNTLAIQYAIRTGTGPIIFDPVQTPPHQSGTYAAYWSTAKGFELWTGGVGGTPVAISSVSISGDTVTIVGAGSFDTVAYAMTSDRSNGSNTGGFPDGRCGIFRNSLGWIGPVSGATFYDWGIAFFQNGL